mmetsp:Transcript_13617/g.32227  ORF Transcript_13617/g.32227 Transcript_13617/m.32227 type:complete len:539 (-) Transcript_13617:51-1667(-)
MTWSYEEVDAEEWNAIEQALQAVASTSHDYPVKKPILMTERNRKLGTLDMTVPTCSDVTEVATAPVKQGRATSELALSPTKNTGIIQGAQSTLGHMEGPEAKRPRALPSSWGAPTSDAPSKMQLPRLWFLGEARYASTAAEVEACCTSLVAAGPTVVGFDIEWRALFARGRPPRPAALVQLCFAKSEPTEDLAAEFALSEAQRGGRGLVCLLLHIIHSGVTPTLRHILASESVQLTGIGSLGDAQKLEVDYSIEARGVVDVPREMLLRGSPCPRGSLSALCSQLLRHELKKDNGVRCGNWEARPLSDAHRGYAATDAMASLLVHLAGLGTRVAPRSPETNPRQDANPGDSAALGRGPLARPPAPEASGVVPADVALLSLHRQRLPPSKREVLSLFSETGMSIEEVADARRVKEDTVRGYLADAMLAGHGYDWRRMGVPDELLARAEGIAAEALAASAPEAASGSCPPLDAEDELRRWGLGLKALRERLPEPATYGQARLALAHLSRTRRGELLAAAAAGPRGDDRSSAAPTDGCSDRR